MLGAALQLGLCAGPAIAGEDPPQSKAGDLWSRPELTGDWGGSRSWLREHGITLEPRLTQFYQGMPAGDGEHGWVYGGKLDLVFGADLTRLGAWEGLTLTVHPEFDYGRSVNARGGTLMPVNTALQFPGLEGADAFDFSSVYFVQRFGGSASLKIGKISIIDY